MKNLRRSRRGMNTILAEVMMVLIVIIMSVIVFVFYNGVFGALLGSRSIPTNDYTIVNVVNLPGNRGTPIPPTGNVTGGGADTTCTSSSPVSHAVTGNVIVPDGQTCYISAPVGGNVQVGVGSSLYVVSGAAIAGNIGAGSSNLVSIQSGNIGSPGVGGNVNIISTNTVIISNSWLGANVIVKGSGTITVTGNYIGGNAEFDKNNSATVTYNTIQGNLTLKGNTQCTAYANTVYGNITGDCTGGGVQTNMGIDVLNTGPASVSIQTLYLQNGPLNSISWNLGAGVPMTCGGVILTSGSCTSFPIVIPVKQIAHVTLLWTSPNASAQIQVVAVAQAGAYLDARIDPVYGLECSVRTALAPEIGSFC